MALVTLSEAKTHCRVTHNLEDSLIQMYMDAAEELIANYLNSENVPQTAAIKGAALLIIQDMYENRGATGEKDFKQNPAVDRLLFPYREKMGI